MDGGENAMSGKWRTWIWAGSVLAMSGWVVGCESDAVPLETSGGEGGTSGSGGAPPGDGGSSCELKPDPDFGPYGHCPYIGRYLGGQEYAQLCDEGQSQWDGTQEGECGGCVCNVSCSDDEECPMPETGEVTPRCQDDLCMLPCDDGEACPDGMKCGEIPYMTGKYCAWVTTEDNSLMCQYDLTEGDDICGKFTTQAACEEAINNDPRQALLACLWATVSTFATGNDACEPIKVEEKCVVGEIINPADPIVDSQRCGDSFVHWHDVGAGTSTLTQIDHCGYRPFDTYVCEFGDPTLPHLCDCACDDAPSPGEIHMNAIPAATPTGELCELRPEPEVGPYGYCGDNVPLAVARPTPIDRCPTGSDVDSFGVPEPDVCSACECIFDCEADSDCPAVESGDVNPVCNAGRCRLPCDDGETCPDGMRCVERSDEGRICAWAEDTETSPACRLTWDNEACAKLTTKESCEAEFHADPGQPSVACLWATESTYATTTESCEAEEVEEHCVAALLNQADAAEPSEHRCGDASVFWRDRGAGSAQLLKLEPCGYQPAEIVLSGYEPCELGDPSLPQLCSCGCE